MSDSVAAARARVAFEDKLNLTKFFNLNKSGIYAKLEKLEHEMDGSETPECDTMFIADGLPIICGLVQIGSTVDDFDNAVSWVREWLPDHVDVVSVLSALAFIYVAEKGYNEFMHCRDEKKKKTWAKIKGRVKRMTAGEGRT